MVRSWRWLLVQQLHVQQVPHRRAAVHAHYHQACTLAGRPVWQLVVAMVAKVLVVVMGSVVVADVVAVVAVALWVCWWLRSVRVALPMLGQGRGSLVSSLAPFIITTSTWSGFCSGSL